MTDLRFFFDKQKQISLIFKYQQKLQVVWWVHATVNLWIAFQMLRLCTALGQHDCIFLVSFCTVAFVPQNYYTISNCSSPASELYEWTKENRPLDDLNFKITKPHIFLDILKKTEIWLSMLFLGKVIFVEEGSAINYCSWTWVDPSQVWGKASRVHPKCPGGFTSNNIMEQRWTWSSQCPVKICLYLHVP